MIVSSTIVSIYRCINFKFGLSETYDLQMCIAQKPQLSKRLIVIYMYKHDSNIQCGYLVFTEQDIL